MALDIGGIFARAGDKDIKGQVTIVVSMDNHGDTDTLEDAIKLIPTTGAKIIIKEGTYNLKGTITIPYSNVTIEGVGDSSVIQFNPTVAATAFYADSKNNIKISNIKIRNIKDTNNTTVGCVGLNICNDSHVSNCWFEYGSNGVVLNACNNCTVANNRFTGRTVSNAGVMISNSYANFVNSNHFSTICDYAISIVTSNRNIFMGNASSSDGTYMFNIDGASNNSFIGNTAKTTLTAMFHLDNVASANSFIGNISQGVGVITTVDDIYNTFVGNTWTSITDLAAANNATNLNFNINRCLAYASGATTCANNTETSILMAAETIDSNAMHDSAGANTRITIIESGYYHITGQLWWDANAAGYREVFLKKNGNTYMAHSRQLAVDGSVSQGESLSTIAYLAKDEYVELKGKQNSGGNLNTVAGLENTFLACYQIS